jgi:hypothetical protein
MTLFEIIELIIHNGKMLPFKCEKTLNQTPLHYALKSGNIEVALWIIQIVRKEQGIEAYSELLNSMDNVSNKSPLLSTLTFQSSINVQS